jgi:hypothetical protein
VQKINPTVRRETGHIALWLAMFSLLVQAIFLTLNRWDYSVLLGSLLGSATALGNLLLVGLMVQKAVTQDEKAAANTVRISQGSRLLMQGAMLTLAAVLPFFNIWAAAVPLLVPRIAVTIRAKCTRGQVFATRDADDEEGEI